MQYIIISNPHPALNPQWSEAMLNCNTGGGLRAPDRCHPADLPSFSQSRPDQFDQLQEPGFRKKPMAPPAARLKLGIRHSIYPHVN